MSHDGRSAFASPEDAEKSRQRRLVLGISSLVLALASGFYGTTNIIAVVNATNAIEAAGGQVPQSAMSLAVTVIAVFCAVALAYLAVGVWNLIARSTSRSAPVIAVMTLALVVVVLTVVFMAATAAASLIQIVSLGLNALIIIRTAAILRKKPLTTVA
jgi:magnesium-transporting ATPase (P-type)